MKLKLRHVLLVSTLLPISLTAQNVDRTKYPDYSSKVNPDPSLMKHKLVMKGKAVATRPDHVDNGKDRYFPPVFNQAGGSCGSASRICYMFSHEMNSFRNLDGKNSHNYYPSHFVWLLTNGNSGKDAFIQNVGVPSAYTYGGQTYSKLFGYQEATDKDFGWMTGYDKWFEAMHNRMLTPTHFPKDVGTEEGREAVKNYLWNHNGDTDYHSGGIVGIGVASGGIWKDIPKTPANDAAGVTGMSYVSKWGTSVDHALTIVGYDDRIEFDLDGNGKYGEASKDEKGAWIIVNSWGDWENGGFIYCPYAYAGASFKSDGTFAKNWWAPEVYTVRKNYRPLRTIKLKMDYSHRSELYLMAGISNNVNAEEPDYTQAFDHFKYAGDGNYGNTNPAPEIPMLGRWADGKLHKEPMEFGYDLTDLSDNLDPNEDMKYFFIIETKKTAIGSGHIYDASILDYAVDTAGLEIPFKTGTEGVSIKNKGNRTIISVVVPGRGYKAPQNATIVDGKLEWNAPIVSSQTLTGYEISKGGEIVANLDANATSYTLPEDAEGSYNICAVYGSHKSTSISVMVPVTATKNVSINLKHSGFTIPGVFSSKYDQATIEFWIRPHSITNWNQSAGPGWGSFMFHANSNGTFTAGWNTGSDRMEVPSTLVNNSWKHIAIVVNKNKMMLYVNGVKKSTIISNNYSGLGGFGDLVFNGSSDNSKNQNANYDEIRIWKVARTDAEIRNYYKRQFADGLLPEGLVAYYKGDIIDANGSAALRDHTSGAHHAVFTNDNYENSTTIPSSVFYETTTAVNITQPKNTVVAGQPVTLQATGSTNIASLKWTIEDAGIKDLAVANPTVIFAHAGEQNVKVVATNIDGKQVEATTTINVAEAAAPSAEFTISKATIATGGRVTFMANQQLVGYKYEWSMPGASIETSNMPNVTVSYSQSGTHQVTLTVTDSKGVKATTTQTVEASKVAPKADFDVSPVVVSKGEKVTLSNRSIYDPDLCKWTLVGSTDVLYGEGHDIVFTPQSAGSYDITLKASNEKGSDETTHKAALVVCNADSKNGISFNQSARIVASQVPFKVNATEVSFDWWMRPKTLTEACCGIGESESTMLIKTNSTGQMSMYTNGKVAASPEGYVIANEWHNYTVSYYKGIVYFFRDGSYIGKASTSIRKIPTIKAFSISTDDAPMNGIVDEFRVWQRSFRDDKESLVRKYVALPLEGDELTEAEKDGLSLYYNFNQNSGSVVDATSNNNTGNRNGFGPDGDAWTESRGVFAINAESAPNITSKYLQNTEKSFTTTGKVFNNYRGSRFMGLADWKIENIVTEKAGISTGAHVDADKDNDFCITTGWDGFASKLDDHKVFQTITLPAGAYTFTANYGKYEGESSNCYLVAAAGSKLPNSSMLSNAIAYKAMATKDETSSNTLVFFFTEPSTVSLGILANMAGNQCLSIDSFVLNAYTLTKLEGTTNGINDVINAEDINNSKDVYDLSGRRVNIPGKGVFIIGGKKVIK